ncbi:TlpA family protein disulfide reductase [Pedobacter sp. CYS-01]|uniref:TlpA family protein disulfide reductase n=2 Tax=Pedobacter montanisoli TaxID=2923277 RepID=A0ABS9ZV36_9SPHI|nr:TlpA disulfide reductase family protein [Pedobacter montanisoli]MCJ0741548.1 TlpA family protein disulfide reductase [Pedobacter montanisoli]
MQIGLFSPAEQTKNATIPADLSKIVFEDTKGNQVSLADLKGKIIFLNFWATWCPPCIAEMPSINKLAQLYKDDKDIVFLMVDADSDFGKSVDFMNKRQYNLPVYKAVSSVPEVIFGGSLPTTIVLDKQGRLSFKEVGAANYNSKKFTNFIEKLKALKD